MTLAKNSLVTLTCERLGADLEGVCRHEGMAVFVPGMLPGETAQVRIVKVQPRFAYGRMASQPEIPSPQRRQPDCPAYPRCGGCTGRHMAYEATLEAKRQQVADCFARIAHLPVDVPPVLGMQNPDHYRNKTALPLGGTADRPQTGFFAPRSHALVPVDACPNALGPSNALCRIVLEWMREHHVSPYVEENHSGTLRHIVIRVSTSGEAMVTLVSRTARLPGTDGLWDRLCQAGCVSLWLNVNPDRTNVIFGKTFQRLNGQEVLSAQLCGLTFRLSPASFFQVNPAQTEILYGTALEFAGLSGHEHVFDLYCGAGTISLMLARHCRHVTGIEIVPEAIENAKENAVLNDIHNADFIAGAVEKELPRLVAAGQKPDVIVVDPPRKGLDPSVVEAVAQTGVNHIVYVSCNVSTQARDAALFHSLGYGISALQSVDMFCWTSGVETVLLMSQQKPDDTIQNRAEEIVRAELIHS